MFQAIGLCVKMVQGKWKKMRMLETSLSSASPRTLGEISDTVQSHQPMS